MNFDHYSKIYIEISIQLLQKSSIKSNAILNYLNFLENTFSVKYNKWYIVWSFRRLFSLNKCIFWRVLLNEKMHFPPVFSNGETQFIIIKTHRKIWSNLVTEMKRNHYQWWIFTYFSFLSMESIQELDWGKLMSYKKRKMCVFFPFVIKENKEIQIKKTALLLWRFRKDLFIKLALEFLLPDFKYC